MWAPVVILVGTLMGGCASVSGSGATAGSPPRGDLVYELCTEVEVKRYQEQGRDKEKSEVMAHLLCRIAATGCREDPRQEGCENTLRILDAHLNASGSSMVFAAAHAGRSDIVTAMIGIGADVNTRVAGGWPPLLIAAAEGHAGTVVTLLDAGAEPNAKNDLGRTALMLASSKGFTPIVRNLLARGADANAVPTDESGWTALMAAARMGHVETVQALLRGGADPTLRDKSGNTALALAEAQGHSAVARALREHAPQSKERPVQSE
jgi:hypothetical protein